MRFAVFPALMVSLAVDIEADPILGQEIDWRDNHDPDSFLLVCIRSHIIASAFLLQAL